MVEKPKETVEQSPVAEAHADDDDQKNTPSTPALNAVPSQPPLSSTRTCPKPAPRTIMSAEKVMTHTVYLWMKFWYLIFIPGQLCATMNRNATVDVQNTKVPYKMFVTLSSSESAHFLQSQS